MNLPTLRILKSSGKFYNVKYTTSSAKSRISKKILHDHFEDGKIDLINPELLDIT